MYISPSFHSHQDTVSSVRSMPTNANLPVPLPQSCVESNPRCCIIYLKIFHYMPLKKKMDSLRKKPNLKKNDQMIVLGETDNNPLILSNF